jgi:hypothetical protein
MKRTALSLAAACCALSGLSYATEFLPFPPSQQQSPSATATYEKQFDASIAKMSCAQLTLLHDDLLKKLNAATTDADKSYYARLIGSVTSQKLMTVPACPN